MMKNKDSWKLQINENREAFEQRKPKDLWASIEKELDQINVKKKDPKTIELWKVYRIAAILIVVIGVGFFMIFNRPENQYAIVEPLHDKIEQPYSQELLEVESFYVAEIDDKLEQVQLLMDDDLAIQEIKILKDEFDELKLEMGDNINDEKVIDAMIQNYRLRLDLLKEILEDLKSDDPSSQQMNYESKSI